MGHTGIEMVKGELSCIVSEGASLRLGEKFDHRIERGGYEGSVMYLFDLVSDAVCVQVDKQLPFVVMAWPSVIQWG